MKVNLLLGTCLLRGDELDMIDKDTLNSKFAIRDSHITLAASALGTVKVNLIWAPVNSEVIWT